MSSETTQEATGQKAAESKKKGPRKQKAAARGRKPAARGKKSTNSQKRTFRTPAERAKILAAADKEGLTAQQVQKRFGVKPVTYYSWRKTGKAKRGPGRPPGSGKKAGARLIAGFDLGGQLREAIKREIARLVPEIIREELGR